MNLNGQIKYLMVEHRILYLLAAKNMCCLIKSKNCNIKSYIDITQ